MSFFENFLQYFRIIYHFFTETKEKEFILKEIEDKDNDTNKQNKTTKLNKIQVTPLKSLLKKFEENQKNNFVSYKYSAINFFYLDSIKTYEDQVLISGVLNFNQNLQSINKKFTIKKNAKIFYDIDKDEIITDDKDFVAGNSNLIMIKKELKNIKNFEADSDSNKYEITYKFNNKKIINKIYIPEVLLNNFKIFIKIKDNILNSYNIYQAINNYILLEYITTDEIIIELITDTFNFDLEPIKKNHSFKFDTINYYNPINYIQYRKKSNCNLRDPKNKKKYSLKEIEYYSKFINFYKHVEYFYDTKSHTFYKLIDNEYYQKNLIYLGEFRNYDLYLFKSPTFEISPFIYSGQSFKLYNPFYDQNLKVEIYISEDIEFCAKELANKYFQIQISSQEVNIQLHSDVYIKQLFKQKQYYLKIVLKRSY